MKFAFILAVSVALMVVVLDSGRPAEAVTCADVSKSLGPCISYLQNGGSPSHDCCNGVSRLNGMAQSKGDRRAACLCIKQTAGRYRNLKSNAARDLPGRCGVDVGVPISWDIDCNS